MASLNIKAKITIGLLFVFFIMLSEAIFLLMQQQSISHHTELLYKHPFYVSNTLRDLKIKVFKVSLLLNEMQFAGNKQQKDSLQREIVLCNTNISRDFRIIYTQYLGNRNDVNNAFAAYSAWKASNTKTDELHLDIHLDKFQSSIKTNTQANLDSVLVHLDIISDFAKNKADTTLKEVVAAERKSKQFAVILLFVSGIGMLVLIRFLSQSIARPIQTFVSKANLMLKKDETGKGIADEKVLIYTIEELQSAFLSIERLNHELGVKNKQLQGFNFDLEEKVEQRTFELSLANKELAFQNKEKEIHAAELIIAINELAFQNKEKEKRAAELTIINKELEQYAHANKELKQFAYIASHELKEPLRTIANFIQVIGEDLAGKLDEKTAGYLRIIDNSTKRMSVLINSLLQFSRLGVNRKLNNVSCKDVIDSVVADLSALIQASGATIEVSEMPELNVYEIEFRQLFQNLITNAIKFQAKGSQPRIQIRSEKINENFRFSVSDNGIGIAPEYFGRVFDIFQRLHSNETEFEGKGIGLAYCKKIVQMHQGEIWVESELGKGSTFYFTIFPILKLEPAMDEKPPTGKDKKLNFGVFPR